MKTILKIITLFLLTFSVNAQKLDNSIKTSISFFEIPKSLDKPNPYFYVTTIKPMGLFNGYQYLQPKDKRGGKFVFYVTGNKSHLDKQIFKILHFDKDFKLVDKATIKKQDDKNVPWIMHCSDDEINVLSRERRKKEQILLYKAYTSPIEKLNFGKAKEFKKIKYRKYKGSPDAIYNSINEKYFAYRLISKDKKYRTIEISLFDNKINHIFTQSITEDKVTPFSYKIDEKNQTVLLLFWIEMERKERKKNGGQYKLRLYKLSASSVKKLDIYPKDRFFGNLGAVVNEDGKYVITGTYSDKPKRSNGFVYIDVDTENMKVNSIKYSPFSNQFLTEKLGSVKKGIKSTPVFRGGYLLNNDETILLMEEKFYRTVRTKYGVTKYTILEDIIAAKFAPDGSVKWAKSIAKKEENQSMIAPQDMSFMSSVVNDKLYFLISASKAKKHKKRGVYFKSGATTLFSRSPNLFIVEMDLEKGAWKYKQLFDAHKNKKHIFTYPDAKNDPYKILFARGKKRKNYFVKVSFGK